MRALAEEVRLGRFDEIMNIVENEKALGKFKDVPDVQAYSYVVSKVLENQQKHYQEQAQKREQTAKRNENKSKAAPNKSKIAKNKASITQEDLFNMSDEEFSKLSIRDIIQFQYTRGKLICLLL